MAGTAAQQPPQWQGQPPQQPPQWQGQPPQQPPQWQGQPPQQPPQWQGQPPQPPSWQQPQQHPGPPQQTPAKQKRKWPIVVGVVGGLFMLLVFGSCLAGLASLGTPAPPATTAPPPVVEEEPAPPPAEEEPAPEPEPEPEDPAAALKDAIESELGDSNRAGVQRVKVTAAAKAGKPITVRFAIQDNLTENMIRRGARSDVVAILEQVDREATWKYSEVVIRGTFSMVDTLGNAEEDQVVFARYSRKTVSKINFENFLSDNAYEVADSRLIHPEFH
jgi:hypothetical protein